MVIVLIPALVMILGLLAYALAANPKVAECGKLAFFAGLLVTLLMLGPAAAQLHVHGAF